VNAWEIGLLANLPTGQKLGFATSPVAFFEDTLTREGWRILPLSVRAATLSSRLPGDFHKDPADRLLVASALDAGATFVTRDTKILGWAQRTGALEVLAC
jgi:PIN domain nuclease of toxin-antitoxin system